MSALDYEGLRKMADEEAARRVKYLWPEDQAQKREKVQREIADHLYRQYVMPPTGR